MYKNKLEFERKYNEEYLGTLNLNIPLLARNKFKIILL